jgi:glycosyltransferase involved in cell wall biosynthesis
MEEKITLDVNVTAIIPSYQPDEKLMQVVRDLSEAGFKDIIVVNDGSDEDRLKYFPKDGSISGCVVINHSENRGKGVAIKTAMAYYAEHKPEDSIGVVTVDGDGQHRAADVIACCRALYHNPDSLILGVRNFSLPNVPKRSRMGNRITAFVFRLFCGIKVSDTQTGLRAVSARYIDDMLKVKGERYEYETNTLLDMKNIGLAPLEVPIETVYIEENQTSHFRTVRDAVRIYALIIKYMSSSMISSFVDEVMFYLFTLLFGAALGNYSVFVCTAAARVISSTLNFIINRRIFDSKGKMSSTVIKYIITATITMCLSATIVHILRELINVDAAILQTLMKVVVDIVLFFLNFRAQRMWVFKE